MKITTSRILGSLLGTFLIIGCVVLINVLAMDWSFRIDFTKNQVYTLSEESKQLARTLDEPVIITAYFSKDLPPAYTRLKEEVDSTFQEYKRYFGSKMQFSFKDPSASDDVKQEAQQSGIPPVQFESVDQDAYSIKEGYAGIVFHYQDKVEIIPIVASMETLEYDISSIVYRLSQDELPTVALMQGEGIMPENGAYQSFMNQLRKVYDVQVVDYANPLPEHTKVLLVAGVQALPQAGQYVIDQALMNGIKVIVMTDGMSITPQNLSGQPMQTGLEELLKNYGVTRTNTFIADNDSGQLRIQSQQGGFTMFQVLSYPLLPNIQVSEELAQLANGVGSLQVPFLSALEIKEDTQATVTPLLTSSETSWLRSYDLPTIPTFPIDADENTRGTHIGGVVMQGPLVSFYQTHEAPEGMEETKIAVDDATLVVIGSSYMINESYPIKAENLSFMSNVVDYLALTEGLGMIRNKKIEINPLRDTTETERWMVKALNIVLVPVLMIGMGLFVFIRRRNRSRLLYTTHE